MARKPKELDIPGEVGAVDTMQHDAFRRDLDIPPMTLAIFNTEAIGEPELHPVRFRAIRRAPTQEEQAP